MVLKNDVKRTMFKAFASIVKVDPRLEASTCYVCVSTLTGCSKRLVISIFIRKETNIYIHNIPINIYNRTQLNKNIRIFSFRNNG